MRLFSVWILLAATALTGYSNTARAWGRHDYITRLALNSAPFAFLQSVLVSPEPIDQAAPDLIKRVLPSVEKWCEEFQKQSGGRDWKPPGDLFLGRKLKGREALLWALEDNIHTPLEIGPEKTAADILINYVEEPDGPLDGGLNESPYIERLKDRMSYFYEADNSHTHAFRHYFVPSSLLPPLFSPRGTAHYRAALYAKLAEGAFSTGHPYWGYRFLAWSIHYVQDVTQPWHTVFLPGISFLKFSKVEMKREVSALHYLTEAFMDTWLGQRVREMIPATPEPNILNWRRLASAETILPASFLESQNSPEILNSLKRQRHLSEPWDALKSDRWFVATMTEHFARSSHDQAPRVTSLTRSFFKPIVDHLSVSLKPTGPTIRMGNTNLDTAQLDFSGDGAGATQFLTPLLSSDFSMAHDRDELLEILTTRVRAAMVGSTRVIAHVLSKVTLNQSTDWLCTRP